MGDAARVALARFNTAHITIIMLPPSADILLIGLRASGKTTLGRMLAAHFNRAFADLDVETLREFDQSSIAEVWRIHGEQRWRDAESAALQRLLDERARSARQPIVIALGGGTPRIPHALGQLVNAQATGGAVIAYLRCSVSTLRQRLVSTPRQTGEARPPLLGDSAIDEVEAILAQREPTYLRLADVVIDANAHAPAQTFTELVAALEQWSPREVRPTARRPSAPDAAAD